MTITAESIIAAFETSLAANTQSKATNLIPTSLAGKTVRGKDKIGADPVAPFFVTPEQINSVTPKDLNCFG